MQQKVVEFQYPSLVLLLVVINIPTYLVLGRFFFKGWRDFFNCIRSVGIVSYAIDVRQRRFGSRPTRDEEADAMYPSFKLLLFVLGSLSCLGAEYHVIAWMLARA